jgi:hypothetical protein
MVGRDAERGNRPMVGTYCPPCTAREFQWRPVEKNGYL